jgi:hypothetical protein
MGGQGGAPGGGDLSIDTQTGFDGDTGQQEMGWTGSAADTASTHGHSESAFHGTPAPNGPSHTAPQRPEEAPPRVPEAPASTPAPIAERSAEPVHQTVAPAPDHRPQVAWSSAPPPQGEHGFDGPGRDE